MLQRVPSVSQCRVRIDEAELAVGRDLIDHGAYARPSVAPRIRVERHGQEAEFKIPILDSTRDKTMTDRKRGPDVKYRIEKDERKIGQRMLRPLRKLE